MFVSIGVVDSPASRPNLCFTLDEGLQVEEVVISTTLAGGDDGGGK
jgi:hypothetical protein